MRLRQDRGKIPHGRHLPALDRTGADHFPMKSFVTKWLSVADS
jgi:hypothetical protein